MYVCMRMYTHMFKSVFSSILDFLVRGASEYADAVNSRRVTSGMNYTKREAEEEEKGEGLNEENQRVHDIEEDE